MTKDMYFEMCDQMGQEPIDEEIPFDIDDFPDLAQAMLQIYGVLADIWDPMGGTYLGKDFSILFNLFDLYGIDQSDRLLGLNILQHLDGVRAKSIRDRVTTAPLTK